jgi:hypothetical protein
VVSVLTEDGVSLGMSRSNGCLVSSDSIASSSGGSSPSTPRIQNKILTMERLFQLRKEDPVVLLQSLGFGSASDSSMTRIPPRFLNGISIQQVHAQPL